MEKFKKLSDQEVYIIKRAMINASYSMFVENKDIYSDLQKVYDILLNEIVSEDGLRTSRESSYEYFTKG